MGAVESNKNIESKYFAQNSDVFKLQGPFSSSNLAKYNYLIRDKGPIEDKFQNKDLQTLQENLVDHYLKNSEIQPLIPSKTRKTLIQKQQIKLVLRLDNNKTKNEQIKIAELFEENCLAFNSLAENNAKTVLIKGSSGSGKKNLMTRLAFDWAEQKQAKQSKFMFLFRINLRKIQESGVVDAYADEQQSLIKIMFVSMSDLILKSFQQKKNSSKKDLFEEAMKKLFRSQKNKKKIILLLEGYDEVYHLENTGENNTQQSKFFLKILKKAKEFNVAITSRPNTAERSKILTNFNRVVEIQKLNDKHIVKFIESFFREKENIRTQLKQAIKTNKKLLKMVENPLNLAMLCSVLEEKNSTQLLKSAVNIDELYLYQEMIKNFSLDFQKNNGKNSQQLEQQFETTSKQNDSSYSNIQPLKVLKQLILEAYQLGKVSISQKSMIQKSKKYSVELKEIQQFGLLKQTIQDNGNKRFNQMYKINFQFIHLSFAQFLVALSIYEGLVKKQQLKEDDENTTNFSQTAELISRNRHSPRYFNIIRYVTMLASKDYWEKKNSLPLEILWVCLTCNIDGVLQFGREQPLKLLMEMLHLCKCPSTDEKGAEYPAIENIAQARRFIEQSFMPRKNSQTNQKMSEENNKEQGMKKHARWYKFIIQSKYIPQRLIEKLGDLALESLSALETRSQNYKKQSAQQMTRQFVDLFKMFFEVASNLIYVNDCIYLSKQKSKIIQAFFRAMSLPDKYLQVKIPALGNIKRLFSSLSEQEVLQIFQHKANLQPEKQELEIILKSFDHQQTYVYAFDLLVYSVNKLHSQQKSAICNRMLWKLQSSLCTKSSVSQNLILTSLSSPIFAQYKQKIIKIRRRYVQSIQKNLYQGEFQIVNQNHIDISAQIKQKISNLLTFYAYKKQLEEENKALKVRQLIQELDRINVEHQIYIQEEDENENDENKDQRKILQKKLLEFVEKQKQKIREKYYLNPLIPNGWGKILNNMPFIIKWMETQSEIKIKRFMIYRVLPKMFQLLEVSEQNSLLKLYQKVISEQIQQNLGETKMNVVEVINKNFDQIGDAQQKEIIDRAVQLLSHYHWGLVKNAILLITQRFDQINEKKQKQIINKTVQLISHYHYGVVKSAISLISKCFTQIDQEQELLIINKALQLLSHSEWGVVNNALQLLSKWFAKSSQAKQKKIINKAVRLLAHHGQNVVSSALCLITQVFPKIDQSQQKEIIIKAVLLLFHDGQNVVSNALSLISQCFDKISQVQQKEIIIKAGSLLSHKDQEVVKNALQLFSRWFNIIDQVQLTGIINKALQLFYKLDYALLKSVLSLLSKSYAKIDQSQQRKVINNSMELLSHYDQSIIKAVHQMLSQWLAKVGLIQKKEIINNVVQLLSHKNQNVVKNAHFLLYQWFDMIDSIQQKEIIFKVIKLLSHDSRTVVKNALSLLSKWFTKIGKTQQQDIIKEAVQLLSHNRQDVVLKALQLLSQWFDKIGSSQQKQLINKAMSLLSRGDWEVVKIALSLIAQCFAKTSLSQQKQIINKTVQLLFHDDENRVKNAILFCSQHFFHLGPQQKEHLFTKMIFFISPSDSSVVDQAIQLILALINKANRLYNSLNSDKFKQSKPIHVSSNQAAKDLVKMIEIFLKNSVSSQNLQHLAYMVFSNKYVLSSACKEIQSLLKTSEILIDQVVKIVKLNSRELAGQYYRVLVELEKVSSKTYEAVEEIYKTSIEETISLIKIEGTKSQTFQTIDQQLKNNSLDVQSFFSKELMRNLLQFRLQNKEMTPQTANFLKFCIHAGLSINFNCRQLEQSKQSTQHIPDAAVYQHTTKDLQYRIAVGDQQYVIQEGQQQYFHLLRDLRKDNASPQFEDGKPRFKNDGQHGVKQAAIDIEIVEQVFLASSSQKEEMKDHALIDWDSAKLLKLQENQQMQFLLSNRNEFGYISTSIIRSKQMQQRTIHPRENKKKKKQFKSKLLGKSKMKTMQIQVFKVMLEKQLSGRSLDYDSIKLTLNNHQKLTQFFIQKDKLVGQKILKLRNQLNQTIQIIKNNKLDMLSNIREELKKLAKSQEEFQKIEQYFDSAYWKLRNIVESLCISTAGVVQTNHYFQFRSQVKFEVIAKDILELIGKVSPDGMIGAAISAITNLIKMKIQQRIDAEFEWKVEVISSFFQKKMQPGNDRQLLMQEICLELTKEKARWILLKVQQKNYELQRKSFFSKLKKKAKQAYQKIRQAGIQKKTLNFFKQNRMSIRAKKDMTTMLVGMMTHAQIMEKGPQRNQMSKIFLNFFKTQAQADHIQKTQQGCGKRMSLCFRVYKQCLCGRDIEENKDEDEDEDEEEDLKVVQQDHIIKETLSEKVKKYILACFCCCKNETNTPSMKQKSLKVHDESTPEIQKQLNKVYDKSRSQMKNQQGKVHDKNCQVKNDQNNQSRLELLNESKQ